MIALFLFLSIAFVCAILLCFGLFDDFLTCCPCLTKFAYLITCFIMFCCAVVLGMAALSVWRQL